MKPEMATTWWLTGLPGAGKTTLAQALAAALRERGEPACVIDGDELRMGLAEAPVKLTVLDLFGTRSQEVHVSTPLEVCEKRDPKGLYARARANQLTQMTGIHAGYEAPVSPALRIDTSQSDLQVAVQQLLRA